MTNDHDRFIARLLDIPGWREEKPLKKYRVFAFYESKRRVLIGGRCAVRMAYAGKLSESVSIGHCGLDNPERLSARM